MCHGDRFCAFNRQKVRWRGVFYVETASLGGRTSGSSFLKNQKALSPETKAVTRDFIVMKEAIKRIAIKSDYAGSDQKRGETAALVAEEGFEPPTQGL